MADEARKTQTRRAVLSYEHLKRLTAESGFQWPDLLIKDYQGIFFDTTFLADEVDDLEVIVLDNSADILELQDSHYPNLGSQVQFLQQQLDGLPEFTMDTEGFTMDSTEFTMDKVIA